MFSSCLRGCCFFSNSSKNSMPMRASEHLIYLEPTKMGNEIIVLKNGSRVCGSGGVVTNVALLQSKSYFEVKLQQSGHWSIGLATLNTDLNKFKGGQDKFSWCINAENLVMHDNQIIHNLNEMYSSETTIADDNDKDLLIPSNEVRTAILPTTSMNRPFLPQEGDIIGVSYNHEELNFFLNGKNLNIPVLIKNTPNANLNNSSEIYPCLHVNDGAILDLIVDNFQYTPPSGFDKIMIEQSLL